MKVVLLLLLSGFCFAPGPSLTVQHETTVDSVGACQGVSYQRGRVFLYGDREVGMIREYRLRADSLAYTGHEYKLTLGGKDVINHPTGLACNGTNPTFIGNSIRLDSAGTRWKAVIYAIDWPGLQRTGTLDGNLLRTIDDDAAVQGTRPEYVQYRHHWYVATADYGNKANAVRLYDPAKLAKATRTSDKGVVVSQFTCSPWVQNLHWIPEKNVLVLIQNQRAGQRWRFTFLDLAASIAAGHEVVLKVVDIDKADELEGFTLLGDTTRGLAVTSARRANAVFVNLTW